MAHDDAGRGHFGLLSLHEWEEVGDGLLHHASRLHHLRQEHLARTEEIADDAHALHERAFDDEQWTAQLCAGLFRVFINIGVDALDQRMRQALFHRPAAPLFGLLRSGLRVAGAGCFELLAIVDQALRRVRSTVQQDIFDQHL